MPKELNPKLKRGFAAMSPERLQEICRKGGKAVPAANRSFSQDPKLAQVAGRKGGKAVPAAKRAFSQDPKLAQVAAQKRAKNRSP